MFPQRLNINLALSEALKHEIVDLNRIVVEDGFSEISFQAQSSQIPHITLLMGDVDSEADFEDIVAACQKFATALSVFSFEVSSPYLKQPSQNYIFSDVLPQDLFLTIRQSLHNGVAQFIKCDDHGNPDTPSHITIAYAQPFYPYPSKLVSMQKPTLGCAEMVQICRTGPRGTCVEVLRQISITG